MKKLKFICAAAGVMLAVGLSVLPAHKTKAAGTTFTYWVVANDGDNYMVTTSSIAYQGGGSPCKVSSTVQEDENGEIPKEDATQLSSQPTLP